MSFCRRLDLFYNMNMKIQFENIFTAILLKLFWKRFQNAFVWYLNTLKYLTLKYFTTYVSLLWYIIINNTLVFQFESRNSVKVRDSHSSFRKHYIFNKLSKAFWQTFFWDVYNGKLEAQNKNNIMHNIQTRLDNFLNYLRSCFWN